MNKTAAVSFFNSGGRLSVMFLFASAMSLLLWSGCTSSSRLGSDGGDLDAELNPSSLESEDSESTPEVADASDSDIEEELADDENSQVSKQAANQQDDELDDAIEPEPEPVAPKPFAQAPEKPAPQVIAQDLSGASSGEVATIASLDFRGNEAGGTVVITADRPLSFQTRRSGDSQVIVEIPNSVLPKKFQRPYDTREFSSPISAINAYQKPGSTISRVVVQLRDPIELSVSTEGTSLLMMPGGLMKTSAASQVAPSQKSGGATNPDDGDAIQLDSQVPVAQDSTAGGRTPGLMQARSLDDFLNGRIAYTGRPISIQVREADVREVFNFIAEESGLNILLSEDVAGKVTLKLRKIPWDQALVVLMQSKNLGYVRQGNILRIAAISSIRKEVDTTRELIESQKALQSLKTKVVPVSFAQANALLVSIRDFLSPRGKVQTDVRTNTIIVTDIPENIERVVAVVKRLDTPTPQVLIEGRIVEFSEQASEVIGFDWNYSVDGYQFATTLGGTSTGAMGVRRDRPIFNNSFGSLTAQLALLETDTKVKVLSAPRILAMNNEAADINQTLSIPVQQAVIGGIGGAAQVTFVYRDVTLLLNVTPQVSNSGSILMNINIQRQFLGAAPNNNAPPPINSRSARTRVLVRNGDVAVIGGIYQSDTSEGSTGVPWLSKIPILGMLFKNINNISSKNELVIFLSPKILQSDNRVTAATAQPSDIQ